MDKKSKILVMFFVVIIFVSIFLTYKRAFLDKDFLIVEEETTEEIIDEVIE